MCVAWGTICLWCCGNIATLPSWWWMCLSPSLRMGRSTITMALKEHTCKGKRRHTASQALCWPLKICSLGRNPSAAFFIHCTWKFKNRWWYNSATMTTEYFSFSFVDLYSSPTDLSSFHLSMDDISGICADHQNAAHSAGTLVLLSSVIVLDI